MGENMERLQPKRPSKKACYYYKRLNDIINHFSSPRKKKKIKVHSLSETIPKAEFSLYSLKKVSSFYQESPNERSIRIPNPNSFLRNSLNRKHVWKGIPVVGITKELNNRVPHNLSTVQKPVIIKEPVRVSSQERTENGRIRRTIFSKRGIMRLASNPTSPLPED